MPVSPKQARTWKHRSWVAFLVLPPVVFMSLFATDATLLGAVITPTVVPPVQPAPDEPWRAILPHLAEFAGYLSSAAQGVSAFAQAHPELVKYLIMAAAGMATLRVGLAFIER